MSATGRNLDGRERNALDFYETPGWCTRAILPYLGEPRTVLDAGAGTGAILREVFDWWGPPSIRFEPKGIERSSELIGRAELQRTELDPPIRIADHIVHGDFFALPLSRKIDLVIANPPYGDAEAFAGRALELGHTVAFLLRLNWLASQKRASFHRAHPADVHVLPRRPSFTNGGTDATEYAWFVWGEGRGNRWSILDVEDT